MFHDGGCEATLLDSKLLHTVLDHVCFTGDADSMAIIPYVNPPGSLPVGRSSSNVGLSPSSSIESFQGSPVSKPSQISMDELEEMEGFLDGLPSKHVGIDHYAYCRQIV